MKIEKNTFIVLVFRHNGGAKRWRVSAGTRSVTCRHVTTAWAICWRRANQQAGNYQAGASGFPQSAW